MWLAIGLLSTFDTFAVSPVDEPMSDAARDPVVLAV
jgi:hypothetical protein